MLRFGLMVGLMVVAPAMAMAQEAGVEDVGAMGWLMLVVGALVGLLASPLGKAIVDLIPGKMDNQVRDWVLQNKDTIDAWSDPNSKEKPPTPNGR